MEQLPSEVIGLIADQISGIHTLFSFRATNKFLHDGADPVFRKRCFSIRKVSISSRRLIALTTITLTRFKNDVTELQIHPIDEDVWEPLCDCCMFTYDASPFDSVPSGSWFAPYYGATRRPVPLHENRLLMPKRATACIVNALDMFPRCDTVSIVDPLASKNALVAKDRMRNMSSATASWVANQVRGSNFNIRAIIWIALVAVSSCERQIKKVDIKANIGFEGSATMNADELPDIQSSNALASMPELKLDLNTASKLPSSKWLSTLDQLLTLFTPLTTLHLNFIFKTPCHAQLVRKICALKAKEIEIDNIECSPHWLLPLTRVENLRKLKVSSMTDVRSSSPRNEWIGLFIGARSERRMESLVFENCRFGRLLIDFGSKKPGSISIPPSPNQTFRGGIGAVLEHLETSPRLCVMTESVSSALPADCLIL